MPWKNKEAEREYKRKYHQENKNKPEYRKHMKDNFLKYRENNRLKCNEVARRSHQNNRDTSLKYYEQNKIVLQSRCNLKTKKLTEPYMVKHLKKLGYNYNDIKQNPELISTHRIIIKTKRLWKQLQTSAI